MYCRDEKVAGLIELYMSLWKEAHPHADKAQRNRKWSEVHKELEEHGHLADDDLILNLIMKELEERDANALAAAEEKARAHDKNRISKYAKGKCTNRTPKKRRRQRK